MNFVDYLTNAAVDIYYTIKNIHEHYCVIIEDLIYLLRERRPPHLCGG
jgi:hypothetical protein